MRLPQPLQDALENEIAAAQGSPGALASASSRLSARYLDGNFAGVFAAPEMRAAYLAVRFPATYAASARVFAYIRDVAPDFAPRTVLDLGSGPGTATFAAAAEFPSLHRATLIERDASLIDIGRRLATIADGLTTNWIRSDLASGVAGVSAHDLVLISYTVGEFASGAADALVSRAWSLASGALVIVEPGTPKNFERLAAIRRNLIAAGAHLVAPCPHHIECPMWAAGDWCHFAQRIERTAVHRRLKQGSLGHEDEKFSYIVASKQPIGHAAARIIRHSQKNPGHVQLQLCTAEGLQRQTVGKSQRERYRAARKAEWGDSWE